jgi:hypothetical protein
MKATETLQTVYLTGFRREDTSCGTLGEDSCTTGTLFIALPTWGTNLELFLLVQPLVAVFFDSKKTFDNKFRFGILRNVHLKML